MKINIIELNLERQINWTLRIIAIILTNVTIIWSNNEHENYESENK